MTDLLESAILHPSANEPMEARASTGDDFMAKTRLNERSRKILGLHARALVTAQNEKSAADMAYKEAAAGVRKMIEARYPPRDMAVLKRYEQAHECHSVSMQLHAGGFQVWHFRRDDKAPFQPGHSCKTHLADETVTASVQKSISADSALKKVLEKKLEDYYSLIAAANTFEDVCEVWPEVEMVRSQCGASAIVVAVTSEVVERIRADVAQRATTN